MAINVSIEQRPYLKHQGTIFAMLENIFILDIFKDQKFKRSQDNLKKVSRFFKIFKS